VCGKNNFLQDKKDNHNEGSNALSSHRRKAISCDPSVGGKVESELKQLKIS